MDATGTERAHLVSLSLGAQRALLLAAEHPERVESSVFICPAVPLGEAVDRSDLPWDEERDHYEGWEKYNRHYWLKDYRGFLEFFFSQMFNEPHSTKLIEDCVGWGLDTTPQTLIDMEVEDWIPADDGARPGPAHAVPLARDPGLARRDHRQGARDRAGGGERGGAGDAERLRARPARPRPRQGQPAAARLHRAAAPGGALGPRGRAAPQARALRLLADRARARAARRGDRRRAAQAAPRARDRLARPAPGHRGAGGARASASTRRARCWPASRGTSSRSRPSTTCTRSRRSGGWTRSCSPTSWSSTT